MAIDQVTESVQRLEKPMLNLKDFQNLSINDQDDLENCFNYGNYENYSTRYPTRYTTSSTSTLSSTPSSSKNANSLWPPLKSARYCKKQMKRNCKTRGITPSMMLMHESSINHHRVTCALNELTCSSDNSVVFDLSNNSQINNRPFWSKKTCHNFWNEYLECDTDLGFSLLSLNEGDSDDGTNGSCPKNCYTRITKSIRKLLKRTFTGAATFSELENFVKTMPLTTSSLSCGQVLNSSDSGATIKLDTPFHRVWLHAICQYHGLSSQSKTVNDNRLVHIKITKKSSKSSNVPRINLYNFLLQLV